jgi:hypothetical protein
MGQFTFSKNLKRHVHINCFFLYFCFAMMSQKKIHPSLLRLIHPPLSSTFYSSCRQDLADQLLGKRQGFRQQGSTFTGTLGTRRLIDVATAVIAITTIPGNGKN